MGCPCSAMWGGRSQGEGREGSRRRCFTEPSAAELQSRAGAGLPHPAPQQGAPRRAWALVEGEGAPPCWQEGAQRPKVNLRGGAAASD